MEKWNGKSLSMAFGNEKFSNEALRSKIQTALLGLDDISAELLAFRALAAEILEQVDGAKALDRDTMARLRKLTGESEDGNG